MATEFAIAIAGTDAEYARQAAAAAWRELDRLENELSRFIESSDIARANRLPRGATITIGDDALRCLIVAAEVSALTACTFDPAYASIRSSDLTPGDPLFALDPATHTLTSLTERLQLDLGAIGKGYALDVMADSLRDWDITSACLQSGGSTALALDPPSGENGWPVGLGEAESRQTLNLTNRALSGSGIAVKGEHVRDPRAGRAAARRERVWAFAPSGAVADALSTAFFVMSDAEVEQFFTRPFGSNLGFAPSLESSLLEEGGPRDSAGGGVGARTRGPALQKTIAAVIARSDGTLAGYGALPEDFVNTTSKTPGRKPTKLDV